MSSRDLRALLRDDPPGAGDRDGRVRVTTHAILAYLERINPTEMYPAAAIRGAWRDSEPVARPNARVGRGIVLIYESDGGRSLILTVYPEGGSA